MIPFSVALRRLRLEAGWSLRQLADQVGVSAPYLSRVENGHDRAPTADRLVAIAAALGVPPRVLLELAAQSGTAVTDYVAREPLAGALFLEIAERGLGATELARVAELVRREFPRDGRVRPAAPERPLADALDVTRVALDVTASELDDVLALAAARLSTAARADGRALLDGLRAAVRATDPSVGNGALIVTASARAKAPVAFLATLARPLPVATVDGAAATLVLVLLVRAAARRDLTLLANAVRLAHRGLAAALATAKTPEVALTTLTRLDL